MNNLGHNQAPEHEIFAAEIRELKIRAESLLDGKPIETEAQASELGKWIGDIKKQKAACEAALKEARAPHQAEVKRLGELYNPSIKMADTALKSGNQAISVWLRKLEQAAIEKARKAREEAERRQAEAKMALMESDGDIVARMEAEEMAEDAKSADIHARVVAKEKPKVSDGSRTIRMRTYKDADIVDEKAAIAWAYRNHKRELMGAVLTIVERAVRHKEGNIDGVKIIERKEAI